MDKYVKIRVNFRFVIIKKEEIINEINKNRPILDPFYFSKMIDL